MSKSKVDYRLKRDLYPLLADSGFVPGKLAREFVIEKNGISCSMRVNLGVIGFFPNPTLGDGFVVEVGTAHPVWGYPEKYIIRVAGLQGLGSSDILGLLQRPASTPGIDFGYFWDYAHMTPDEAVADLIKAVENGLQEFVDLWTDPEAAWLRVTSDEPEGDETSVGGVFMEGSLKPWNMNLTSFHMKLAARLGYVEEEIALIHRMGELMAEVNLDGPGEPYETRLKELEALL